MASARSMVDSFSGSRPPLVVVTGDDGCSSFEQAIAITCGRVAERMHWRELATAPWATLHRSVVVMDAAGIADDVLSDALPRLEAAGIEAALIVSVDEQRIDMANMLLGPRTQILCLPTEAERVGALAIGMEMMGRPPGISDAVAEGEADRLEKLNEEVARIAEVLARLTRRNETGAASPQHTAADRRMAFGAEPVGDLTIEPAEVRRAIRARRMRDQFFGAGLFEEPGWDMILDLFAAELERTRVSVSSLCIAAAVAPTTALRWISKLVDAGLFERHPDPFDRRRAYMELSPSAAEAMRNYVGTLRRAGLSLG